MKSVALIAGTRPEIIKLAPLWFSFLNTSEFKPVFIHTGQHDEMAKQMFEVFGITPHASLDVMRPGQDLNQLFARLTESLNEELSTLKPDLVVVQGDTSSTLAAALAAYHLQIPVAHVEAGLRTHDFSSPYPEEMNRVLVSKLASFHFTPTKKADENLLKEGISQHIYCVGNTVVDALEMTLRKLREKRPPLHAKLEELLDSQERIVVVTAHRRENFDSGLEVLCEALDQLAAATEGTQIVFPVHLNPTVRDKVHSLLADRPSITLLEPLGYEEFILLLSKASLAITDSGGIQEEAPSLRVPVIIVRDTTEREELLNANLGRLVPPTDVQSIVEAAKSMLQGVSQTVVENPFGDGKAAERIVKVLSNEL